VSRLTVLGGGSWGTALATVLAPNFDSTSLWMHDRDHAIATAASRENGRYLPGVKLHEGISVSSDTGACLAQADIVLVAIPSAFLREMLTALASQIPARALIVSATKGLEPHTRLRMTEVVSEASGVSLDRVLALSGPSFAQEVAGLRPTAVVVAGRNEPVLEAQSAFARPFFRVYSSEDVVGVELGGALKNVVAIGAGMAVGLDLGHNAVAALITRGLAELTRLAGAMGAQPRTMGGLSGLGDLVLTCTGELSRNRQLGIELTRSRRATEVLCLNTKTTEGVRTAGVAVELGIRLGVEMPIASQVNAVLESRRSPEQAIRSLMERSLKEE
jgi:glycerol-3-phosphate dehydrogenase (NAD(P)+)